MLIVIGFTSLSYHLSRQSRLRMVLKEFGLVHQVVIPTMYKNALLVSLLVVGTWACSSRPSGGGGCGCGGGGGGCGCRSKARAVLQLEGDNAIEEDFGQIYGLRLWESRKVPSNVSMAELYDPNYHFHACCVERGLSRGCQSVCNFPAYNQNTIQAMLIGMHECPLDSMPELQFCAAQGRDHSQCCINRGVNQVEAGDKCLVFCNQIPDRYTHIDYTYASCFGKFDDMKRCFYDNIQMKAKNFYVGKNY